MSLVLTGLCSFSSTCSLLLSFFLSVSPSLCLPLSSTLSPPNPSFSTPLFLSHPHVYSSKALAFILIFMTCALRGVLLGAACLWIFFFFFSLFFVTLSCLTEFPTDSNMRTLAYSSRAIYSEALMRACWHAQRLWRLLTALSLTARVTRSNQT